MKSSSDWYSSFADNIDSFIEENMQEYEIKDKLAVLLNKVDTFNLNNQTFEETLNNFLSMKKDVYSDSYDDFTSLCMSLQNFNFQKLYFDDINFDDFQIDESVARNITKQNLFIATNLLKKANLIVKYSLNEFDVSAKYNFSEFPLGQQINIKKSYILSRFIQEICESKTLSEALIVKFGDIISKIEEED